MSVLGLFPGQGSQSVGMAKLWKENSAQAGELFDLADKVLKFRISKLCLEGPIEELTLTYNAQPALLLSSVVSYFCSEIPITSAAGHSLGEYSALVASGVLNFEDAIFLVHKRGTYMQEAVPVGHGTMLAVMGANEDQLNDLIREHVTGTVEIANINSPGQIVLAGSSQDMKAFQGVLSNSGIKVIPLNVSAPFHCSLMAPARDMLVQDLEATTFNEPRIPVYSNFTAKKISSGAQAKELLKEQVCGTVRWLEQMQTLIGKEKVTSTIEFGPGGVLSKLLKRINPTPNRYSVEDPSSANTVRSALSLS